MRIRHSILPIEFLDSMNTSGAEKINGVKVRMGSQRYKLFKKNRCCVKCGIEGDFLAIEIDDIDPMPKTYHINMYAMLENGGEVLMTKDHIVPRSKGGRNALFNYQTMCATCNNEKGNGDPPTPKKKTNHGVSNIDRIFDTWIDHKTIKKHLFHKIGNLCELVTYIENGMIIYQDKNMNDKYDMMYPVIHIAEYGVRTLNIELENNDYYIIEE